MQTEPLIDRVGRMPRLSNASRNRQKPTRMPYSCHAQFGMSGSRLAPVGGARIWRGIGWSISQCSTLATGQTATCRPPGSVRRGRSTAAR
nr:hypothetical protein [Methylobacterium organophilum]